MKLLIIRLSAMGDVAMSVSVLSALSAQHAEHNIYLITNKLYNSFFLNIPNLTILNPDLKGKHKGLKGLYFFYKELKKEINPDIFVDIHDILRTKIIRFFFKLDGVKTVKIDKGRKEKKKLTRKKNKLLKPLKHTTERYVDTFLKANILIRIQPRTITELSINTLETSNLLQGSEKKIGIAPFARHIQKQYPIKKTEELIQNLVKDNYKVFLFGGGKKEKQIAEKIAEKIPNVISLIGKFSLSEEIAFIDKLDVMITPDSGNMHIAALTSVKIISIWGATHPYAGFTPNVPEANLYIIQNNKIACRPCSIFGNKRCYKNTLECLTSIKPEEIFQVCKRITG